MAIVVGADAVWPFYLPMCPGQSRPIPGSGVDAATRRIQTRVLGGVESRRRRSPGPRRWPRGYHLEFVDVAVLRPDPEMLKSVPGDLMFRYTFLPYRRESGRLVLVMADPADVPVVDDLSLLLRTSIQPAVGTPSAIQEALKRSQGTQRVLEQASESFKIQIVPARTTAGTDLSIEKIQQDQSPIIRLVDSTLFDALNRRASDIHVETRDNEVVIKYRIDGVLQQAMKPIAREHHSTVISRIKVMAELDIAEKRVPQDGRFRVRVARPGDRLPRFDHAVRAWRGRGDPHPRQGEPVEAVRLAAPGRAGLRPARAGALSALHS